jgi:hypothetical protein
MTLRVFVLTPFILKVLRGKGLIKCCRRCGASFKVGDVIISIVGAKRKWYCRDCAIKFKLI